MNFIKRIISDKDERNLIINIFWAFVVKGLSLFVSFFSMPLYIKYFDDEAVLGLWFTILSVLSWISVCDLGLGNGLRNRLTEALAVNDVALGKKIVSSVYVIVSAIIIPILAVIIAAVCFLDLNLFFNISVSVISKKTLLISVIILLFGVGMSFVLKLINNVIYAIQKSSINNMLHLVTTALPLFYIAVFKGEDIEQNLIALSIVHVLAINLPLLVTSIILFGGKKLREYRPSLKAYDFTVAKGTLGFGMQFFLAQLLFMFLLSTNEMFITRIFGTEFVVEYSIYYRLYMMIGSLFMIALTPLWSKVTRDLAKKNYNKIRITNKVLYGISFLAMLAELIIVPLTPWIVKIWIGNEVVIDYRVAFVFAIFGGLYILNVVLTTVANGMGNLRSQIFFYGLGSILKIPVIFLLKTQVEHWSIVIAYNCIVLLVFNIFQYFFIENKIKNLIKMEE